MTRSQITLQDAFAWATASIAFALILLSDLALHFTVGGRSATAYMTVAALLLVTAGLAFHVARNIRPPVGQNSSELQGTAKQGKWALPLSGLTALLFVAHQWAGSFTELDDLTGLQRLLSHALLTAGMIFFYSHKTSRDLLMKALLVAGVLGATLVLIDNLGAFNLLGSRHSSMFFLIPLVLGLSLPRFGFLQLIAVVTILSAIFSTGSRASAAVAIVIMVLSVLFMKGTLLIRRILFLVTGLVTFAMFLTFNPTVQERFLFNPGDRAFSIEFPGSNREQEVNSPRPVADAKQEATVVFLNTSGRIGVWSALLEEGISKAPLLGNGAGFAAEFVSEEFDWTHPHNEYIRIFADHGLIGLVLFCTSILSLGIHFVRRPDLSAPSRFVGVGSLAVLGLMSITDLPLVSLGVVLPAAIAIGQSINGEGSSKNLL